MAGRTFGSCAVALNKAGTRKFEAKCEGFIMIGYSQVAKAYRLYNKNNCSIIERRDVMFNEDSFHKDNGSGTRKSSSNDYLTISVDNSVMQRGGSSRQEIKYTDVLDKDQSLESAEDEMDGKSESSSGPEELIPEVNCEESKTNRVLRPRKAPQELNSMIEDAVPATVKETFNSPNRKQWYNAMKTEISSLRKNSTWSLINLPADAKVIGNW